MHLEKAALFNPWVRLEPLAQEHREILRAACDADRETWLRFYSYSMAGEHFDAEWNAAWPTARRSPAASPSP